MQNRIRSKEIKVKNLKYVAVSCVFSPINEKQEIDTAKIIQKFNQGKKKCNFYLLDKLK